MNMEKRSIKERIKDKIEQIGEFKEELYGMIPQNITLEEYKKDLKTKAICERYFEKIIEGVVDLAFLIIREKGLKIPEDEESSFIIISENKIISEILAARFREAKGMRNVIVHQYGEIDDEKVFHAIFEELEKDIKEFLDNIKEVIK